MACIADEIPPPSRRTRTTFDPRPTTFSTHRFARGVGGGKYRPGQLMPRYWRQFQLPESCSPDLPVVALVRVASTVPACWLRSRVNVTLSALPVCHTLVASVLCTSIVMLDPW